MGSEDNGIVFGAPGIQVNLVEKAGSSASRAKDGVGLTAMAVSTTAAADESIMRRYPQRFAKNGEQGHINTALEERPERNRID